MGICAAIPTRMIFREFAMTDAAIAPRFDWTREEIAALFDLPLPDLMLRP